MVVQATELNSFWKVIEDYETILVTGGQPRHTYLVHAQMSDPQ